MSRKIVGVTVGTTIPKPNLKQTDPKKGDYVNGREMLTSDWNADEGEYGHVLNRTHWIENSRVELMPETTYTFYAGNDRTLETPLGLTPGKTYVVNFDGVEYRCNAFSIALGGPYKVTLLGDNSHRDIGAPATSEPFGIMEMDAETAAALTGTSKYLLYIKQHVTDNRQDFTFSIYEESEIIHKLDVKYLPNGVPYSEGGGEIAELLTPTQLEGGEGEFYLPASYGISLVDGGSYVVNWNGVDYTCTAQFFEMEGESAIVLGNLGLALGMGEDTGEPFVMLYNEAHASMGMCLYVIPLDGSEQVTLGLAGSPPEIIHKLDPKFLPDGVPYATGSYGTILPDFTITSEEDMARVPSLGLIPGNTYTVKIAGFGEWTCTAVTANISGGFTFPVVGIGNLGDWTGVNTGEPFALIEIPPAFVAEVGMSVILQPLVDDLQLPVTFSIWGGSKEIRKLDNDCLDLAWLPTMNEIQIAAEKTVTNDMKNGFPELNKNMVYDGMPLVIYWDGVRYETTVIGDPNGAELPIAIVMPGGVVLFALYFNNNTSYLQIPDGGEHVASVYTVKANQMPEAFLPESVSGVIVRSSTEGSTKLFKITVDDSGTITATEV